MNKREENKRSMYRAVTAVLADNRPLVESVPALQQTVDKFNQATARVDKVDSAYTTARDGATAAKQKAENALIDTMVTVAKPMSVFAKHNGKQDLRELCDLTPSALKKMRDSDLLQRGKELVTAANANADGITPYGVDEALRTSLQTSVSDYETGLEGQGSTNAAGAASRQELDEAFSDVDEILYEELDGLMEIMQMREPSFYNEYQAARVIRDIGVGRGSSAGERLAAS